MILKSYILNGCFESLNDCILKVISEVLTFENGVRIFEGVIY